MQTAISLLKTFIKIPSFVSKTNNEIPLADVCLTLLEPLKPIWTITKQPVAESRYNILLTNSDTPEILLTAHLDTVPPSDRWTRNPFSPTEEGDRLYGLGAVDMKAGLATIMNNLLRFGNETNERLAVLLYVGEEYDFCGMNAFLAQSSIRPTLLINPEPTDLKILRGCRGVLECSFVVEGRAAHAAMGDGVNAIDVATQATNEVRQALKNSVSLILGESTLNLAWIRGGVEQNSQIISRPNIVPSIAECTFEIRVASNTITETWITEILTRAIETKYARLRSLSFPLSVGAMESSSDLPERVTKIFQDYPKGNPKTCGYFDTQMITAERESSPIICGPGPSLCAHAADEYVYLSDLEKLDVSIGRLFQGA